MDLRKRVVQFFEFHKAEGKCFTVKHFTDETVSRRSVYQILKTYEERGNVERKSGSGRPAKIMSKGKLKFMRRKLVNGKYHKSQRAIAAKLNL